MNLCVVIFPATPEVGGFVGVCVEKHIATQGPTLTHVHMNMEVSFATYAVMDVEEGYELLSRLPDSPRVYREAFMKAPEKLDFECIEMEFEDTTLEDQEKANEIRGPRHYRYTDQAPPPPPVPRGPKGGRRVAA